MITLPFQIIKTCLYRLFIKLNVTLLTKKSTTMRIKTLLLIICISFMVVTANHAQERASFRYISPVPGSKYLNPEQTIALRHGDILDASTVRNALITVKGSERGEIPGSMKLSVDGRTLIFTPEKPFSLKEKISVEVAGGIRTETGMELESLSFGFEIKPGANYPMLVDYYQREEQELESSMERLNNGTENNSHYEYGNRENNDYPAGFPTPQVAVHDNPSPGYVFLGPRPFGGADYGTYLVMLDNYGIPVFYQEWPRRTNDFKTLPNNQLTFCDFDNSHPEINKYLVMDSHFTITDTLTMGNGYMVDQHDVLMRENGNHFLMAYDPQLVNMDTVVPGGDTAATVIGFVVQELDSEHNVIFQWRSWDHYEITDANHTDFTAKNIDYVHGNAFEIDYDGNLLMSQRNMEEITKIDMNTGEIIWRLGLHAKNNMFDFINDTVGFSWQHDVRRLDNGNITVYDNGNYHTPPFSQALEYSIDEENFTAELVWNYVHDPVIYARATGAHRRLDNGNAFVCWGLTWPVNVSEVDMNNSLKWELHWPMNVWEYRSFKFDWTTDYFETNVDTIDFGEYDDYVPWPSIFTITNNAGHDIQITSTHNHWDSYTVITPLPLDIPAGETRQMTINFFPTMKGHIDDVLTLNYESMVMDTLPRRVSRQIFLTGYVPDDEAPKTTITPSDGATEVSQEAQIVIEFDEPVTRADGSAIKYTDLKDIVLFNIVEGADVEFTATVNVWKTKITLVPDTLYPLTDYHVEILPNAIADREGNAVTAAQVSEFATEDAQGIGENIPEKIKIYPNPTNGNFYVEVTDHRAVSVRVLDMNGKTVISMTPGSEKISLDLGSQPGGIYFVEILLEGVDEPVRKRVVKN